MQACGQASSFIGVAGCTRTGACGYVKKSGPSVLRESHKIMLRALAKGLTVTVDFKVRCTTFNPKEMGTKCNRSVWHR